MFTVVVDPALVDPGYLGGLPGTHEPGHLSGVGLGLCFDEGAMLRLEFLIQRDGQPLGHRLTFVDSDAVETLAATTEFSRWGEIPPITAPAPGNVTPLRNLLDGLRHLLGCRRTRAAPMPGRDMAVARSPEDDFRRPGHSVVRFRGLCACERSERQRSTRGAP